jgi:hypothetical protein
MPRRRPVLRNAGVVACVGAVLVLTGCGPDPVRIDSPELDGSEAADCRRLVDQLPERVEGQERREPSVAYGAAWGDPAIVLRCGVDEPAEFDELASCQIVNDVAWFIPESQIVGEPVDILMTTVGRSPNVEVALPEDYFPPATAMVELADAVGRTTTEVDPCG